MKITILPYYLRYTEFAPQVRFALADLARVRLAARDRFIAAKSQHKQLIATNGDVVEIVLMRQRCEDILHTLEAIDEEIMVIYKAHGRVN